MIPTSFIQWIAALDSSTSVSARVAVHAAFAHPVEVGEEIVARIGIDAQALVVVLVEVGDELADFLGAIVPETESRARVARVAAVFRFRRLLQHDDAPGARLLRGHGRVERGAAAADHDDVALLVFTHGRLSRVIFRNYR